MAHLSGPNEPVTLQESNNHVESDSASESENRHKHDEPADEERQDPETLLKAYITKLKTLNRLILI